MKKVTLHFPSLHELSAFSKRLTNGYFLNTSNLTLTGNIPHTQANIAIQFYRAVLMETTDKVYSYELVA